MSVHSFSVTGRGVFLYVDDRNCARDFLWDVELLVVKPMLAARFS